MKEKIKEIQALLSELEAEVSNEQEQQFTKNYNALELPSIVSSIVEYLNPLITPYEIAVYWSLFNESIVKTGEQYVRISVSRLCTVSKSSYETKSKTVESTIRKTINSLKDKEIIFIAGDTNRNGTLYKIAIPDEIPLCKEFMQKSVEKEFLAVDINKELDFYNVAENRLKIFERDGYKCHYCSKQLTRFSATLDHIQPVSKGGDNSFENLITACLHCNSERGNKPVMDYIADNS